VVVHQAGDTYLIDNIELKSGGMPGVQARCSKSPDDRDPSANVMFGTTMQGTLDGDWLKVNFLEGAPKQQEMGKGIGVPMPAGVVRYVPATVNGHKVVVHQAGDTYLIDNIELKSGGMPGVQARCSKNPDDRDPSANVLFGTTMQGTLDGDWLQVVVEMGGGGGPKPAGVPAGSHINMVQEKYAGPNTKMFAFGGCLLCGCLACLIFACPVDERDVYVAPNGDKYTVNGARILG
jgi:hypothetical protein